MRDVPPTEAPALLPELRPLGVSFNPRQPPATENGSLFAALKVATGRVTEVCTEGHRVQEFLAFLQQVVAAYPRRELHVVVDNLSTHKHPAVRAWLERLPWVTLHFTPTSGSWLKLVEAFFSIITRQALRHGSFPTVADLVAAIERFITAWNDRCRPSTWTKDPDPSSRRPPTRAAARYNDVSYGALGLRSRAGARA